MTEINHNASDNRTTPDEDGLTPIPGDSVNVASNSNSSSSGSDPLIELLLIVGGFLLANEILS